MRTAFPACLALDVFAKSEYAKVKKPKDRLNAWLSFFCTENTEDAIRLCEIYPWLSEAYKEMAGFAANPEELIGMFSEMLHELDRNTTRYMVDDMREKIEKQGKTITEQQGTITELQGTVVEQQEAMAEKDESIAELQGSVTELQKLVAEQKAEINRLLKNQNNA